jgi:ribosomal protein S18 acetylase RimI-like enzyme
MIDLEPPFRRAKPEDAPALAEFINFAGEGLPLYLWTKMAGSGETPWDVGRMRARREEGGFSYRNAVVMDCDGEVVAGIVGYLLPDLPEAIDCDKMPAMFVPAQELENLAPGTWYLNALATRPQFRGRGYGARLLALAERLAKDQGAKGVSILVSDANSGARRLYRRCGYREFAKRPMVKEDCEIPGENWLLLTKAV